MSFCFEIYLESLTDKVGGRVFNVVINGLSYEAGLDLFAMNGRVQKKPGQGI
jgi:hypothetical protein